MMVAVNFRPKVTKALVMVPGRVECGGGAQMHQAPLKIVENHKTSSRTKNITVSLGLETIETTN